MSRAFRGTIAAAAAIIIVAGGAATISWWRADREAEAAVEQPHTGPSAQITRDTIALTESFDGTLDYGESSTIEAAGKGVLTSITDDERAIERDTELYAVNQSPVIALTGSTPMYRDLAPGDEGDDVGQLERNLDKLGYSGFAVDRSYTWATAAAVEQWQQDHDLEPTGTVRATDVVFVPFGSRVESVQAELGERLNPGSPLLELTGHDQQVTVEAEVADRDLLSAGTEVRIETADGEQVVGTVIDVSVRAAASGSDDSSGQGGGDGEESSDTEPVLHAQIDLAEELAADLIGSPVDVAVDVEQHKDVLVVPVSALLAMSGGGYGVEVIADDRSVEVVPVDTGLFAEGLAEVTGDGISEGMTVGVAGR
jgi:peptidoglycan hydrolase-like protein with peptidoglycan-binding domain